MAGTQSSGHLSYILYGFQQTVNDFFFFYHLCASDGLSSVEMNGRVAFD